MATFTPVDENDEDTGPSFQSDTDTETEADPTEEEATAPAATTATSAGPNLVPQSGGRPAPTSAPTGPNVVDLKNTNTLNKTTRGTVDPLAAGNVQSSAKAAQDANTQLGEAQQNLNTKMQDAAITAETARQEQISHIQAVDQAHREIVDQQQTELTAAQKDYESASIDPNHYWKQQPLGGKIISLAAIALSGLGNAYSSAASPGASQQNGAWDIIKGQIDQDIDAQKANLEKQGKSINMRSSELQNLRQRFGDERTADTLFAAQQYDAFGKLLSAEAAKSNNPVFAARADSANAAIQQAVSEKMLDATKGMQDNATSIVTKQVAAKTAQMSINKDALGKKPQIQQSAVDAQEAIDQVTENQKKDGRFGSAIESLKAKFGVSAADGYNKLNADKQILFLNETRALLNNRISARGLEEMAKANPNMFNDPKVFVESLKAFRDNNIATASNIDTANSGLMRTGNDIPAFTALRDKVAREQIIKKNK
jgi:hypothetical protein